MSKQKNKCIKCQNYDKENDCCKIDNAKKGCSETDFSKCTDYVINEKLIMF